MGDRKHYVYAHAMKSTDVISRFRNRATQKIVFLCNKFPSLVSIDFVSCFVTHTTHSPAFIKTLSLFDVVFS